MYFFHCLLTNTELCMHLLMCKYFRIKNP
uniref:Uncharacterized protein n=1 Tax=Arundo donax TaxID=35708 RepID=A0A0A8ZIN8_ARUDO